MVTHYIAIITTGLLSFCGYKSTNRSCNCNYSYYYWLVITIVFDNSNSLLTTRVNQFINHDRRIQSSNNWSTVVTLVGCALLTARNWLVHLPCRVVAAVRITWDSSRGLWSSGKLRALLGAASLHRNDLRAASAVAARPFCGSATGGAAGRTGHVLPGINQLN